MALVDLITTERPPLPIELQCEMAASSYVLNDLSGSSSKPQGASAMESG